MFYLPLIYPHYPWWRKVLIFCYNWVMWSLPASSDALADDVGTHYQVAITFFVVMGWIALTAPWLLLYAGILVSLQGVALCMLAGYLAVGALYHAFEHYGPYA